MPENNPSIVNVAIIGGDSYCKELLEKTSSDYREKQGSARVVAIADPDHLSPGMILAKERNLICISDYHELYKPEYDIHLIIVLTPEQSVLDDILKTRPMRIRVMSYYVFEIFWKSIRNNENKLREHNEEIKTILNAIQDFILVIRPDKIIEEVNDAFLQKMHFTREDVIGKKCYEVLQRYGDSCDQSDIVCPLSEVIKNKHSSRQVVVRPGRDGKPRYIDVSVFPIWEKDGKISKFIEVSRDITKRRLEEEEITRRLESMVEERTKELRETHEKLLHQDKMASLGKLAASVVHEINNPIAGILNLIMLIKRITREGPITEKELNNFGQYLNLMELETRRISRIVSNLLAFSRQPRVELNRLNINRLLEITLFMNSNLLKINGIRVETKTDSDLPEFFGTEDQLQQVFMNIVSNAAEAMEASPVRLLTIETCHSLAGNSVIVSFKDTGSGIPKENLTRLFEPFFTTKKKGKGVGLGLSVAYGIIKEHGGCINVESETGKGTTFQIVLPITHYSQGIAEI